MTIKRIAFLILCGFLGGFYCLATGAVASALGLIPSFPAYGGEDDFGLRFMIFLAGVLPSFIAMGDLVGRITISNRRTWLRILFGAFAGTVLTFIAGRLLMPAIEHLSSRNSSNGAVVAFFAGWIVLTLVGILLASRRSKERAD